MVLTKDDIRKAEDWKIQIIEVPEWGGEIGVKSMSGTERDEFDQFMYNRRESDNIIGDIRGLKIELLLRVCCAEDGTLLFEEDDREWLNSKSAKALDRVFDVAQKMNGLTADDVEELAGN